jgi:hypothetical protein
MLTTAIIITSSLQLGHTCKPEHQLAARSIRAGSRDQQHQGLHSQQRCTLLHLSLLLQQLLQLRTQ